MEPKGTYGDPVDIPAQTDAQENLGLPPAIPTKETKTAEELAAMIHDDLGMIDGCPARGVGVTVYGLNPWNVLLTFSVEAGPVPNRADLQAFCEDHHGAVETTIRHCHVVPRSYA